MPPAPVNFSTFCLRSLAALIELGTRRRLPRLISRIVAGLLHRGGDVLDRVVERVMRFDPLGADLASGSNAATDRRSSGSKMSSGGHCLSVLAVSQRGGVAAATIALGDQVGAAAREARQSHDDGDHLSGSAAAGGRRRCGGHRRGGRADGLRRGRIHRRLRRGRGLLRRVPLPVGGLPPSRASRCSLMLFSNARLWPIGRPSTARSPRPLWPRSVAASARRN